MHFPVRHRRSAWVPIPGVELPSAEGALTWDDRPELSERADAAGRDRPRATPPSRRCSWLPTRRHWPGNGVRPALALCPAGHFRLTAKPWWGVRSPHPRALRRAARPCSARSAKAWWKCPQRWRRCGGLPVTPCLQKPAAHSGRSAPPGGGYYTRLGPDRVLSGRSPAVCGFGCAGIRWGRAPTPAPVSA